VVTGPVVPPPGVRPEDRRRAQLLAVVLLVMLMISLLLGAWDLASARQGGARLLTLDTLLSSGSVLALIGCIVANRLGNYRLAASGSVWSTTILIFAIAIPSPSLDDLGMLYYLVVPLLFAGIFLPLRGTLLLGVSSSLGTVLLGLAIPEVPLSRLPVITVAMIAAVVLLATHYRDLLESDRRRALAESEERFRSMITHAPEAIVLFHGSDGTVVEVNDQAVEIFGVGRDELRHRGFRETAVGQDPANAVAVDTLMARFDQALTGGEPIFDLEFRRSTGAVTACEVRLVRLPAAGPSLVRGSFVDVTDRRQTEARLRHLATHDILTGLPNRDLFDDRLANALRRSRRSGSHVAVAFLDIDDFKIVNDAFGHVQGDRLLREVSARLRNCLRESDTVARQGGDEFSILLESVSGRVGAVPILWKIITALSAPITLSGRDIYVTASLGVSVFPHDGENEEQLLQNADTALYQAKADGKSTYRFFSARMVQPAIDRLAMASRLRHALERQELFLEYQPQVDISSGKVVAFEALLRWRQGEQKVVEPSVFIPVAEETGLIVEIGTWALRSACAHLADLRQSGRPDLRMSVNVSGRQLRHGSLAATVVDAMSRHHLPDGSLVLELTENILFRDGSAERLGELRGAGARLAVDDFGTGYSTLWQLPRFPLEELKIDKRFADGIVSQPHDDAIVRGIVEICTRLGLRVVAEGVESHGQLRRFASHGCNVVQGYYYSRPCSPEVCTGLLAPGRFPPLRAER
jgi:diguanylate cyclase (GGDEF)-like protein/PAS domain S-box-containing protein